MPWASLFFLLFAGMACFFALAVLFTPNVVRMAFYLVLSLGATAGLFFLAGADFVGAIQIMLYVGGTVVLLVFGVMLTAQSQFISMRTGSGEWILAALVAGSFLAILIPTALAIDRPRPHASALEAIPSEHPPMVTATRLGQVMLGARVDKLQQQDEALRQGMSGYLLPFEIISIHLLVVLVGAAYLARAKRRVRPSPVETSP